MSDSQRTYPQREDGPPSGAFVPVMWRVITSNINMNAGHLVIGLSFNCEDGRVIRVLMTGEEAAVVASLLNGEVRDYAARTSHSDRSSGIPSADVSPQEAA